MYLNIDKVIAVLIGMLIAAFLIGNGAHILDWLRFSNLFPFSEHAKASPAFALVWSCFWAIVILGVLKLLIRRDKM